MQLKAVLLDVGGVLMDETTLYTLMQSQLLELLRQDGLEVSSKELADVMQQAWRHRVFPFRAACIWHFVRPDVERFQRLVENVSSLPKLHAIWTPQLMPGAKEVVAALSRKYRLALAANQPVQIKKFLRTQGILEHFEYDFVSEELRMGKPDLLFFTVILDTLGMSPEEAVMVGDRLDADILPAKQLGMRTIRVLSWPFSLQEVRAPEEEPDATIRKLTELPEVIEALT